MKPEERAREILEELRPREFFKKVDQYRRGSLPSDTSSRDGGRSADAPTPHFDDADQWVMQAEGDYHAAVSLGTAALDAGHWSRALKHLRRAQRIEGSVLIAALPVPDPVKCGNPFCNNDLEGGRLSGNCVTCRVHAFRNNGETRNAPKEVEA